MELVFTPKSIRKMKHFIYNHGKKLTLLLGLAVALIIILSASVEASGNEQPCGNKEVAKYQEALAELEAYMFRDNKNLEAEMNNFIKRFDTKLKLSEEGKAKESDCTRDKLTKLVNSSEPVAAYKNTWYFMFDK